MNTIFKKLLRLTFITLFAGLAIYYFYPESKFSINKTIDKIVAYKSRKELLAYSHGELLKRYKISTGSKSVGQKQYEGNRKTPEGIYTINDKNPDSGFYKNMGISNPNQQDIDRARKPSKPQCNTLTKTIRISRY